MKTSLFIKRAIFLVMPIVLFLFLDIVILRGGFGVRKARMIPSRTRFAAQMPETAAQIKTNLRIKSFSFKQKNAAKIAEKAAFFKKGVKIGVSCVIENAGEEHVRNFKSVIRIPGKELATARTTLLQPGQSLSLEGEFSPETNGITYLACRTDVLAELRESSKNDNNEIAALYVED